MVCATRHHALPIRGTDYKGALLHTRDHSDAVRFTNNKVGNASSGVPSISRTTWVAASRKAIAINSCNPGCRDQFAGVGLLNRSFAQC